MLIKKLVKLIIFTIMMLISVSLFSSKIVAILPFDSVFETIAKEQKDAILLAMENYDNNLEIVFKDSKGSAEGAITALEEYINEFGHPEAVISCASWVSTALNPVTAKKGIFHIAIGSASIDRKIENHTIRMTVDEKIEEELLSYYLLQYSKIAIVFMNNQLGQNWSKTLNKKLGDKIKLNLAYNPESKDFQKSLTEIKNTDPDVIVLISSSEAADICKAIRQAGIDAQLVGTRPIERPEMLAENQYTEGLIYTFPSFDSENVMLDMFRNKYNYEPTFFALEAYDTMVSLISGLKEKSQKDLFDWYRGQTFIGALGSVKIENNGDAVYPYMFKEIKNGKFVIADFQYYLILEQTRQELNTVFNKMDTDLKNASLALKTGITGKKADQTIKNLYELNKFSYDVITIDSKGIVKNVYPKNHTNVLGKDISYHEQVTRIIETQKPVVSKAFETTNGFIGFDFEYPVFDAKNNYLGSVSILSKPKFFGEVINDKIASFPVEICIMQTDGTIVYDINDEEIGLNLFTAELFNDFPTLKQLGRKMAVYPQGAGTYQFFDNNMDKIVDKELIWTNISIHGTEFRLALFYEKQN